MITLGNYTQFRRTHVHDGCTGKRRFPTFEAADDERRRLMRHTHVSPRGELRAYDCRRCGWWHLGHHSWRPLET